MRRAGRTIPDPSILGAITQLNRTADFLYRNGCALNGQRIAELASVERRVGDRAAGFDLRQRIPSGVVLLEKGQRLAAECPCGPRPGVAGFGETERPKHHAARRPGHHRADLRKGRAQQQREFAAARHTGHCKQAVTEPRLQNPRTFRHGGRELLCFWLIRLRATESYTSPTVYTALANPFTRSRLV